MRPSKRGTRIAHVMSLFLALLLVAAPAVAGPVIIDGTDANDHGSASASANLLGWLYMQKSLENLGSTVNPSVAKVVVNLGADASTQAGNAIASAFSMSTLPALGWTITNVNGDVAITTWLTSLSTLNTGILYIPTAGNASGDLSSAELIAVNGGAVSINNYVGGAGTPASGGALFAMGETGTGAYGWLSSLIPGIIVTDQGGGGIGTNLTLTGDGNTAFPGLTNADLSSGPWHANFSGALGGLSVLATAPDSQGVLRNVILGGGAGTIIGCGGPGQPACPTVPEPSTLLLLGAAASVAGVIGRIRARRRRS